MKTRQEINQYISSNEYPLEKLFFSNKVKEELAARRKKLESTEQYMDAVASNPKLAENLDKDVAIGRILSVGEVYNVDRIFAALDGEGKRMDIPRSAVNRSGEAVILSQNAVQKTGRIVDGYIDDQEDFDEIVAVLKEEGIANELLDNMRQSFMKNGAIVYQRGAYFALKPFLDESIPGFTRVLPSAPAEADTLPELKPVNEYGATKPTFAPVNTSTHTDNKPSIIKPSEDKIPEMPISFVEYLKKVDKEFVTVESEVVKDPMFQEFFTSLKNRYSYYKDLSPEKMAAEIIVRPALWIRLSPQTKVWVQNIVTRNKDGFERLTSQVRSLAHGDKLDELKQSLSK